MSRAEALLSFNQLAPPERVPPPNWRPDPIQVYALEEERSPGLEIVTVTRWKHETHGWEEHVIVFAYARDLDRYQVLRSFARGEPIPQRPRKRPSS